jgi:hypothetical protein
MKNRIVKCLLSVNVDKTCNHWYHGSQSVLDLTPVLAGRHFDGRGTQELGKVKLFLIFN